MYVGKTHTKNIVPMEWNEAQQRQFFHQLVSVTRMSSEGYRNRDANRRGPRACPGASEPVACVYPERPRLENMVVQVLDTLRRITRQA